MAIPKKQLGEILVDSNLITREELNRALEQQKGSHELLGETLVRCGLIDEETLAQALAKQNGLKYLPADKLFVEPEAAKLFSEQLARKYRALPISVTNNLVTVATSDPLNVVALDSIRSTTGKQVELVVVSPSTLNHAIDKAYHPLATGTAGPAQPGRAGVTPDSTIVKLVEKIVNEAIEAGASDIHIEPGESDVRVRYRIDGLLRTHLTFSLAAHPPLVSRIKIMADMDISERRLPQDGRIQINDPARDVDLRVSTLPTIFGEKVVIRVLDKSRAITRLEELGFSPQTRLAYEELIGKPYGMILVTGPTGSGKTTTLMATLRKLNTPEKNIVTVEDPVEYQIPGINQVQVNPKAGLTFASGLRSILRQDPNVIMVGEIRDSETAEIAIRAALTGHLVFSTLHTNNAAGAITRLLDMGIEPFLVSSSVIGVLAQRLARKICPRCKEAYNLPSTAVERHLFGLPDSVTQLYRGKGCPSCGGTGFKGRTGLFELMVVRDPIRTLINRRESSDAITREAVNNGMVPLLNDGIQKAIEGITSLEEVQRVALAE